MMDTLISKLSLLLNLLTDVKKKSNKLFINNYSLAIFFEKKIH